MPVGAESHTSRVGGVAGQGRARVRRVGEIPQPNGGIEAAGGQGVPVGLNATVSTLLVWPVRGWPREISDTRAR